MTNDHKRKTDCDYIEGSINKLHPVKENFKGNFSFTSTFEIQFETTSKLFPIITYSVINKLL